MTAAEEVKLLQAMVDMVRTAEYLWKTFWMNLTFFAEKHFFFEMMVTDVIEMVGMFFLGFLIFGGREEQTWGPDVTIPTRGWTMPLECVAHGCNPAHMFRVLHLLPYAL